MFDTIILLTGPVEQAALTTLLRSLNPQLRVRPTETLDDLTALEPVLLARSRLIGFVTPVIVPPDILDALGYGAYNFHPGPPRYPGWAPAHFALYDQATEFGATVHEMAARVDSGTIVDVASFPVPADIGVRELESLAYARLARQFWQLAKTLATQAGPLPACPVHWSNRRNSRSAYRALCDIPLDITREELYRRLRAFGGDDFGISPAIHLHGVEFRAVIRPAERATPAA
jgi:methionyl-tRNA formyltransferase